MFPVHELELDSYLPDAPGICRVAPRKSIFAKFDLDRDGKLNRQEVEAYMKATINFDLPQAVLEQIAARHSSEAEMSIFCKLGAARESGSDEVP